MKLIRAEFRIQNPQTWRMEAREQCENQNPKCKEPACGTLRENEGDFKIQNLKRHGGRGEGQKRQLEE